MNDHDLIVDFDFDHDELVRMFQALANPDAPESMTWSPDPRDTNASMRSHP